jgi:hypothetical protein
VDARKLVSITFAIELEEDDDRSPEQLATAIIRTMRAGQPYTWGDERAPLSIKAVPGDQS